MTTPETSPRARRSGRTPTGEAGAASTLSDHGRDRHVHLRRSRPCARPHRGAHTRSMPRVGCAASTWPVAAHQEFTYGHNGTLARRRDVDGANHVTRDVASPDRLVWIEDGALVLQFTDGGRIVARHDVAGDAAHLAAHRSRRFARPRHRCEWRRRALPAVRSLWSGARAQRHERRYRKASRRARRPGPTWSCSVLVGTARASAGSCRRIRWSPTRTTRSRGTRTRTPATTRRATSIPPAETSGRSSAWCWRRSRSSP